MKARTRKLRIGIVGCGAIGSRIAKSLKKELRKECRLTAVFDIDSDKAKKLAQVFHRPKIAKKTLDELIQNSDLIVEAINAKSTKDVLLKAIKARKHILAMSVGKLLTHQNILALAKRNKCDVLIPSGAIAGIDAIKSASLRHISSVTLTTRKPPAGLANNPYLKQKRLNLNKIKKETVVFDGSVKEAITHFPQNINVAATLALAAHVTSKLRIRILSSPKFKKNSHEIHVKGDFGELTSRTDNVVCPDNPKTSYLAVLSGIQTLKQYCQNIKIGT
jgi:aspartate dehydrogenase